MTSDEHCAVCGTEEQPEKGWIYKYSHLEPESAEDGGLKFKTADEADPICSLDCLDEYKEE